MCEFYKLLEKLCSNEIVVRNYVACQLLLTHKQYKI